MRYYLIAAVAAVVGAGQALAVDAAYCPPAERWVDVRETVKVQVPVTEYVDEPYQVTVTKMVPVEKEVEVQQGRWVNETRTVPTTKTVYVNETYTVNEARWERRPETRMRNVTRTVTEYEDRTVTRRVYDRVCDPETGRERRVAREVCETERVPVKRKVCVQEPYTVQVRTRVMVPVTKTRRVAQTVPDTKEVCERRWVAETVKKRVTEMQPVQETQTLTRKRAVCVTKTVDQEVVRRVKVTD